MTVAPAPKLDVIHPAKFSEEVLEFLDGLIPLGVEVLDPMAGVGYIHRLNGRATRGVEIEPEWANCHHRTTVGDCTAMPFADNTWPWVVTSCVYGNRMSDHYDAQERCKACGGTGEQPGHERDVQALACEKCEGKGHRTYRRHTYRGYLGRPLHANNSGQLQWGPKYRAFHADKAWPEVARVTAKGGRFVLNVKNHWRDHELQRVAEWHLETLLGMETTYWKPLWKLESIDVVEVKSLGHGQNYEAREPYEFVFVLERV